MPGLPLLLVIIGLILRLATPFHTLGEVLIGIGIALCVFVLFFVAAAFGAMATIIKKGRL